MNSFNKLYNIILESIISQNKESRAKLLANLQNSKDIENYLNELASKGNIQNKIADFLAKMFSTKQITNTNDQRINQIITIFKRQSNIDIQKDYDLDKFLYSYKTLLKREQDKKKSNDIISYIDNNVPQFTQKRVDDKVEDGLVIYKVEQSQDGQWAVRKIIDLCWGEDANPWCLVARSNDYNDQTDEHELTKAWEYWERYDAYPKHIAFQGNQLLAFSANDQKETVWWDRNDEDSEYLKLKDGTEYQTEQYSWSSEDLRKFHEIAVRSFIKNNKLSLKDGVYNTPDSVYIYNDILLDGKLPLKFGKIGGSFVCRRCSDLKSLQNAPKYVEKSLDLLYCTSLTSLIGCPQYVGDYFVFDHNNLVTSLQGAPKYVGKDFRCDNISKLNNVDDLPKTVGGKVIFENCRSLPKELKLKIFLTQNPSLTLNQQTGRYDSKGDHSIRVTAQDVVDGRFPVKFGRIEGNFYCASPALTTLQNGPTYVGKDFSCHGSQNLTSLIGAPKIVKRKFDCGWCDKLKNLQGAPEEVYQFECTGCDGLTSLIGSPKSVQRFTCKSCSNLVSLENNIEKWQYIGIFDCSGCKSLTNVKNGPPRPLHFIAANCPSLKLDPQKDKYVRLKG